MQSISTLNILLIEDDYNESILIQDMLASLPDYQWQVEWVSDYEAAVAAACSGNFDACLLDYHLGQFSGVDVLHAAQAQGCRLPMILLTGQGSKEIDLEAMQAGAVDYLDKARLRPATLERAVRYAVVQGRAVEALRQSEERFRVLVETIPGSVFIYQGGRLHYVNQTMIQLTGYEQAHLLSEDLDLETVGVLAPRLDSALAQQQSLHYELSIRTAAGDERWIDLAAAPINWEAAPAVLGTFLDSTERKLAELAAYEQELALAALEERQRLARDLHDAVSQTLFSASVTAETLPRLWERDPAAVQDGLQSLARLTKGALAEMRSLLLELRPATLSEISLRDLLHQLVEAYASRTNTLIMTNLLVQELLPPEVQEVLYRATQEALNNVIKYAQAEHVQIDLYPTSQGLRPTGVRPTGVRLMIRDDGIGFDPGAVPAKHLGLRMMRERVESIQGLLAVESAPGEGTTVSIEWQEQGQA